MHRNRSWFVPRTPLMQILETKQSSGSWRENHCWVWVADRDIQCISRPWRSAVGGAIFGFSNAPQCDRRAGRLLYRMQHLLRCSLVLVRCSLVRQEVPFLKTPDSILWTKIEKFPDVTGLLRCSRRAERDSTSPID